MRLPVIQTESRLGGRLWHRPRGPQLTSYLKSLGGRPELRNHGVGWMRAVERLRNGGVPPNPVFLMPATHCMPRQGELNVSAGERTRRAFKRIYKSRAVTRPGDFQILGSTDFQNPARQEGALSSSHPSLVR